MILFEDFNKARNMEKFTTNLNGVKVIAFDFWGVFAKMNPPMYNYMKKYGINSDNYLKKIHNLIIMRDLGKISEKDFLQKCSNVIKLKLPYPLLKYKNKPKTLNNNLVRVIIKLKKKFKIVLLSNNNRAYGKEYLFKTKLNKLFDIIVLPYQVGYRKPSTKIYKILIKKLGCGPSKILYVDDERDKLLPPKKIGFKTLLYQKGKTDKVLAKL